jgi:prepilin-type N-terminal cleavage/methylation domain-containing protein
MKSFKPTAWRHGRAFTLIELLVVITIIGILAGLTLAGTGMVRKKVRIARAQAELGRIGAAIESYKAALGFFPPDNPLSAAAPPLFYELSGSIIQPDGKTYQTIAGNESVTTNLIIKYFARGGFANASGDKSEVKSFFTSVHGIGCAEMFSGGEDVELLKVSSEGPQPAQIPGLPTWLSGSNPWHYVSKNPTNHPGGFDLWGFITVGKKTYLISNWGSAREI